MLRQPQVSWFFFSNSIAGFELSISQYSAGSVDICFYSNYRNEGGPVFGDMFFLKNTSNDKVQIFIS
jgi:hypothetical protein